MVNTPEQARQLVSEVKYAPVGARGFSGVSRAAGFGDIRGHELANAGNAEVMLIVQLESAEAVENCGAIAAVEGVDMIFVGPSDLAQSLGVPGQEKSQTVVDAMQRIMGEVGDLAPVSTVAMTGEDVAIWRSAGVRCFLTSSVRPIRNAFAAVYSELSGGEGEG